MKQLTIEQLLLLHKKLIARTGGADGIRSKALIVSSLNSVYQTFENTDLYPSLHEKAARLCFSLISNHGFIDGNKRIGIFAMLSFLELNEITLSFTQKELIDLGLGVARGDIDYNGVLVWVKSHCSEKDL